MTKCIKLSLVAMFLLFSTTCLACTRINNHEVWQNKHVSYLFVNKTLYIDELNNESDCYSFKVVGRHLYLTDVFGYLDTSIELYKSTKKRIWLLIDGKIFKFKRYEHEC